MKPRFSLLRDVSDVVRAYELMESLHLKMPANVSALVHHERDMVMHDVESENDSKTKNVVMTGCHHDRANETLLRNARRVEQANVSPPYTEHPRDWLSCRKL